MAAIAARLDSIVGPLVGAPDLAARSRRGPDTMACIRYQRGADERSPAPGQQRMGPHSDYTTFTILRADAVAGLEIMTRAGWTPVMPEPDALLVNVGDLLAMWTNDVWPSTLHRVPIHGDDRDPPVRRSVAYFHYPDLDVEVRPSTRFVGGPGHYPPVLVRDHVRAKLIGPKTARASEGTSTVSGRLSEAPD